MKHCLSLKDKFPQLAFLSQKSEEQLAAVSFINTTDTLQVKAIETITMSVTIKVPTTNSVLFTCQHIATC